ncbi:MAG: N-carbamoyl-D-amino-acid hydrolase [Gemmatimonadetes bacterium]|jgi:N-carbamoyl-D-amino-acid hydrolase|nr:N-carbamoyl-D-amino-acid hydrolase [Gemmatimonadota bacterium]MBT6147156.1 N-carbamoyl-D-amino-acid hydrolase [Gemmatimonadota bacterium]MBT7864620.1 N-carbamoyl-D-amino-acid hydrolase [Gemmatimonadota bacterium]
MSRTLRIGAAQQGPVSKGESRADVVERLLAMMRQGAEVGCDLVVFTEVALVPFFSHWHMSDEEEIDAYFEHDMPGPDTQPLFDEAQRLGIGFHLGFAELVAEEGEIRHYNSSVLVGADGRIIGKYRKIHLPGYDRFQHGQPFQNLEKLYFRVGDLGFRTWEAFGGTVGMMICNDRRWPESYRVLALRGAELILMGYNTPVHNPANPQNDHLAGFHNHLSLQAGAYQNAAWVVAVAKAGIEEGVEQIGGSCIVAPTGQIVAQATTLSDELIVAACDLDLAARLRQSTLNFAAHRRIEHYDLIARRTGYGTPQGGDED